MIVSCYLKSKSMDGVFTSLAIGLRIVQHDSTGLYLFNTSGLRPRQRTACTEFRSPSPPKSKPALL